jgi:hypothetical protein
MIPTSATERMELNMGSTSGGNGKGASPEKQMYGRILAVHTQLVDAKRAAEHAAKQQIRVPGRPPPPQGIAIKPELVLFLEEVAFFLAEQCLALNAAVTQLQEKFDGRSGDRDGGASPIIVEAGSGSSGPGGG